MTRRLKEKLSANLSLEQLRQIYTSFDIIGDIIIIKTSDDSSVDAQAAANQIMAIHKNVKAVFMQTSPILGTYRVRALRLLAGEDRTTTMHRESGCIFMVDVEKCYFSPRLSYERSRVAGLVKNGETVVNMFAGVGCFSIRIAKTVGKTKIYSIDVNPIAVKYLEENIKINLVNSQVIPILGDSKEVVNAQLQGKADRVLMPLPEKALEYLSIAVSALKKDGGWIHYYDFQHAAGTENPIEKTKQKVAEKLDTLGMGYTFAFSRIVRSTGPNWYQTVLDIRVDKLPSKF